VILSSPSDSQNQIYKKLSVNKCVHSDALRA
jgi:hypothetical protein